MSQNKGGAKMMRASLLIEGKVQGVFFRASTREMALQLGLKGYVRNLPDGRVQAVLVGAQDKLEQAVAWCRQGPPLALVRAIQVDFGPADSEFTGFDVR